MFVFYHPIPFCPSQSVPCMEKQPLIWFLLFTGYFLPILVKVKVFSHVLLFVTPMDCSPPGFSIHGSFAGKDTGVGCHFLLQEIFPTQGSVSCIASRFFPVWATRPILEFHINGLLHVTFLLLGSFTQCITLRFMQAVAYFRDLNPSDFEECPTVQIHSSVNGHLDCFL